MKPRSFPREKFQRQQNNESQALDFFVKVQIFLMEPALTLAKDFWSWMIYRRIIKFWLKFGL